MDETQEQQQQPGEVAVNIQELIGELGNQISQQAINLATTRVLLREKDDRIRDLEQVVNQQAALLAEKRTESPNGV